MKRRLEHRAPGIHRAPEQAEGRLAALSDFERLKKSEQRLFHGASGFNEVLRVAGESTPPVSALPRGMSMRATVPGLPVMSMKGSCDGKLGVRGPEVAVRTRPSKPSSKSELRKVVGRAPEEER